MTAILVSLLLVAPADLKAGAASVDITPPIGTPMAGYYHERASVGTHDPLWAKALVLEAGGKKVALVSLDLIGTTASMVADARRRIEETTGVEGADVMISATHAHTGPVLRDRGEREADYGGETPLAVKYSDELVGKIAESVKRAEANLRPARLSTARGAEPSIAFNRRFHMKDGSVGWNPGKLNPEIVKPAGPIDPEVALVYLEGADDPRKPIAAYVNYAVHLDNVGGLEFSSDMPHTVYDLLGRFKGPEMVTLYTSGCCGDINHIDVTWAEPQKGHENAARMGAILSGEILSAWRKLKPEDAAGLRVKAAKVKLPLAPIEPGEVERSRAVIARQGDKAGAPKFLELVKAYQALDVAHRKGEPLEVEVQVVALGDRVAWVSLPGEIFVELGLAIKEKSPYPTTIIAELANGSIGYIPTKRAYPHGNYEVVSARCAEGSGEMLVEAALKLLNELRGEAK